MKKIITTIYQANRKVFLQKRYKWVFIISFLILGLLYAIIPVFTTPGNTFLFQLKIFSLTDYIFLVVLSAVNALFVSLQSFLIVQKKKTKIIGTTITGSLGSFVAGFIGMAGCPACVAPLFALFGIGFGGVMFSLKYQIYFIIIILLIMITSLYFISKKITQSCDSCRI